MKYIIIILFLSFSLNSQTKYVNPFIGTTNGGNTFPGAVVPWGMVSVSPHNSPGAPAGYIYGEEYFSGFGHTHLSGTGCADLGNVVITAVKSGEPSSVQRFSKESAKPGYYSLYLNSAETKAEVTAKIRAGIIRFTPDKPGKLDIIIDPSTTLAITGGGSVKIVSDTEIEGTSISGGFCGETNRQTVYFVSRFSQDAALFKLISGSKEIHGKDASIIDSPLVCRISFNIEKQLQIKTGISYVSIANARENLETEMPDWDFESAIKKADGMWNEVLSRITVEGKNEDDKIKFYTALYHMLIHPNVISDVNKQYPLMGRKGIGTLTEGERYTVYSLWDTYRTLHPFLTLVYPEKQSEMIKSMLGMYKENGYLPKWELAGLETYMMVGDPAAPVIADSYIKGIRDFDKELALEAMLKPVMLKKGKKAPPIRAGYHDILKWGYIPFEQDHNEDWWVWGPVSTMLEYNLSDWTIAQYARALNRNDLYDTLLSRSLLYKNIFDSTTLFVRPRLKSGEWINPFDSLITEGSGDWEGSGGPGYVEGNAWNYTWFVPHDIPGLINLFGGEEIFSQKLLRSFKEKWFTINNEPDFAYPYLFSYIKGKEHLTKQLVTGIMKNEFGMGPDGLPGNDDCGTTSGWFIFSALGFYPDCPASEEYRIGVPLFDRVQVNLNNKYYPGKSIIIKKSDKQIGDYKIKHSDLINGGSFDL